MITVQAGVVSPDARHIYVMSDSLSQRGPGEYASGVIGWSRGPRGGIRFAEPVACFVHPLIGRRPPKCGVVSEWPDSLAGVPDVIGPDLYARSMAISHDGRSLYVSYASSVIGFARDPATGALQQMPQAGGCLVRALAPGTSCTLTRAIRGAEHLVVAPDDGTVYLTFNGERTSGVAVLARNRASGALTQLPGPAGCVSPGLPGCTRARQLTRTSDVQVAPDGRTVYVTSTHFPGGGISVFDRDRRDGSLVQRPGRQGCTNRTGARGCHRERRFAPVDSAAIAADGTRLFTIERESIRGPTLHRIAHDGTVGGSAPAPRLPPRRESPDELAIGANDELVVAGHSFGVYVYTATRARSMHLAACWTVLRVRPCRRVGDLDLGLPNSEPIPAPNGVVYVDGNGGLYTLRL
ncbi:lactonase family protein [Solirubrobacter taibaiensis]|nr:lactonase family protein [Solirubrobacter taibaiensis]